MAQTDKGSFGAKGTMQRFKQSIKKPTNKAILDKGFLAWWCKLSNKVSALNTSSLILWYKYESRIELFFFLLQLQYKPRESKNHH